MIYGHLTIQSSEFNENAIEFSNIDPRKYSLESHRRMEKEKRKKKVKTKLQKRLVAGANVFYY